MTDRELLEAAAKAAGYVLEWDSLRFAGQPTEFRASVEGRLWDPLTDDGDALRLVVKLNLTVGFDTLPDGPVVYVQADWYGDFDEGYRLMEWLGKDASAATRRAIVRAAASIKDQP